MAKKRRKRKKKVFFPKVQAIFCLLSLLFIIGCSIYYGIRLIKYYKIYNPKSESGETLLTLANKIIDDSELVEEGDGVYFITNNYVYKGNNVNNYILVDDVLFRIIRVNSDKTVDIVMDEYINRLSWNDKTTDFLNSSIKEYLDNKILNIFNKDNLTVTTICKDKIAELSEISCNSTDNNSYVRLLGLNDYLNSLNSDKTYINSGNEYLWLYNNGETNVWHTTGTYISNSNPTNVYGIKPVITLKNSVVYLNGDGTLENPYIIENDKEIKVGSYLDINDNIYIVYEVGDDYLKVQSNEVLKDKRIFDSSNSNYQDSSLKNYLENTYLEKLKIDSYLKEVDFSGYKSKIGILSKNDLKFNSSLTAYYLSDQNNKKVLVYNGSVIESDTNAKRNIRISLGIKKNIKILSGNGSKYAPFIVEE